MIITHPEQNNRGLKKDHLYLHYSSSLHLGGGLKPRTKNTPQKPLVNMENCEFTFQNPVINCTEVLGCTEPSQIVV